MNEIVTYRLVYPFSRQFIPVHLSYGTKCISYIVIHLVWGGIHMNIVTQTSVNNMNQTMGNVPQIPMLQARLAKDGTDDDIKMAFSEEAILMDNVSDRTARLKSLVRKGILMEQTGVLKDSDTFIFDGDDLVSFSVGIVAHIGSSKVVL